MKEEDDLGEGLRLYAAGDLNGALKHMNNSIQKNHNEILAYAQKSIILQDLEMYEESIKCSEQGIGICGGIMKNGQWTDVQISPNDLMTTYANMWRVKAMALEKLGRLEEAIAHYKVITKNNPDDDSSYRRMGDLLVHLGKFRDAKRSYKKSIKCNPENISAHLGYAGILEQEGAFLKAITSYDAAKNAILKKNSIIDSNTGRLRADYVNSHVGKAIALVKAEMYEEAMSLFDDLIEKEPGYPTPYVWKGMTLLKMGNDEEAILCADKAILAAPHEPASYYAKITALTNLGRVKDAIRCYDQVIKFESTDQYIFYEKALLHLKNGDGQDAFDCLDRAIKLDSSYVEPLIVKINLCMYYYESKKDLNAFYAGLDTVDKLITLQPNNETVILMKADILSKSRHTMKDAIKCFEDAEKISPDNIHVIFNKGQVLKNLGMYKKSFDCFKRVTEIDPKNAYAFYMMGNIKEILKKFNAAIKYYTDALKLKPDYKDAKLAKKNLNKRIVFHDN